MPSPSPGTAPQSEADRLRARAVWLYYVEGMTQNEISTQLGISRVMVVRLLADARRRNEVRISIATALSDVIELERGLEKKFGIARVIVAPHADKTADPTKVIAAAAGNYLSGAMRPGMTVGVGWGRTLYNALPYITGATLDDFRVVSLLGGIAAARRFNPAEFAWQFAELFQGEGFLIPAPAVVDSPATKHALIERCGLAAIIEMANHLDLAVFSVGGLEDIATSYRTGYITEADRQSLLKVGAVGDVLYNFIDAEGKVVDHEVNARVISVDLRQLRRAKERVLISGGAHKLEALRAAVLGLSPSVLVTDEQTARDLLAE